MRRLSGNLLLVASALLLYAAAVASRERVEDLFRHSKLVDNPIHARMAREADALGLDASFARQVRTGRFDVRENQLFRQMPEGGWDVIVFGDSALAWSFSAELAGQAAGRKVAFLAQTSAYANQKLFDLAQEVARRYLKPGGELVFLFSSGAWVHPPHLDAPSEDLASLTRLAVPGAGTRASRTFQQDLRWATWSLNEALQLPDLPLYESYIEPVVAPRYHAARKEAAFGAGCAELQWQEGGGSVFYICDPSVPGLPAPRAAQRARMDLGDELCRTNPNALPTVAAMEENIGRLANLRGVRKSVAVPFSIDQSAMWMYRCVRPEVWAASGASLLDLPKLAARTLGEREYEFEGGPHVANTSSVLTSYVLGVGLRGAAAAPGP